ncbi:MAG: radical SAM protein [Chloroflexota bacterium]
MSSIGSVLDQLTRPGEIFKQEANGAIRCFACGHRCLIRPGLRGICQVRFNKDGELRVPWGYVAALQADPIEKKPFSHVMPGETALTFGMLGCDFHCGYCFPGQTRVVTSKGILTLEETFALGNERLTTADAKISHPKELKTIAGSGNWREVRQVFKHDYRGRLTTLKALSLPELKCTPDHRVYATVDPGQTPKPMRAHELTSQHLLAVPKKAPPQFGQHFFDNIPFGNEIKILEDFILFPIQEIGAEDFHGAVYNLEVEEEHNYLANFALVSNCQNWYTSQAMRDPESDSSLGLIRKITPQQMVDAARRTQASVVVSSYNEPLITSEWAAAIFKEAKAAGLKCAYVSNGNNTPEVMDYLRPYLDAYKVDLKSMNDKNYRKLGGVLQNTLDGIKRARDMGLWVEVVTLVVPGFNDSNEELWDAARFLAGVSLDIPWHVTAFHKDYKMTENDNTDARTLQRAADIGREAGLHFVYAGNLPGRVGEYEDTLCPSCNTTLVKRRGYVVREYRITKEGACPKCGTRIPGVWPEDPSEVNLDGIGMPLPVY